MNRHGLNLQNRPSRAVEPPPKAPPMREVLAAAEDAQRMADYWRLRAVEAEADARGLRKQIERQ